MGWITLSNPFPMKNRKSIQPYILGSGMSAKAIKFALSIIQQKNTSFEINQSVDLPRDQKLEDIEFSPLVAPILFIANPHTFHTPRIIEAEKKGFEIIFSEKPLCTSVEELKQLQTVKSKVAILHVYRQTWGVQELRRLIESGGLGEVFCIESRYWQASAAERALNGQSSKPWKNDISLTGPFDTLLDLVPHWLDLISFLQEPHSIKAGSIVPLYCNAEMPHRDTHVNLALEFDNNSKAYGSVSKTVHGASNFLELNILASKKSAHWQFDNPDQIVIGSGRKKEIIARTNISQGSEFPAYHGMGWLEGYIEIIQQACEQISENKLCGVPTLDSSIKQMSKLFELLKN